MADELHSADMLRQIRLDRLQDKLVTEGWRPEQVVGKGLIWRHGKGESAFEIPLPLSTTARDYPLRIQEALRVLSEQCGVPVRALMTDLLRTPTPRGSLDELGRRLRLVS